MADKVTPAAVPNPAPVIKPSDFPEPAPQAPTPRKSKATAAAEPAFSTSAVDPDGDVMDVNPTPRGERQLAQALDTPGYVPDPFGGKAGPTPLNGEDLARRGGGPDERVTNRQDELVKKFRGDKAVQQLLRDEASKRLGTTPKELEGTEAGLRATPAEGTPSDATAATTTETETPAVKVDEVAEIAKAQRENRELKQRIKLAEGARTEAKRIEAWREIAKDYPIAAMREVLGLEPEAIYTDDVQGKSKNAGDKIKPDPAKLIEADDAKAGQNAELEEERRLRREAEGRLAFAEGQRRAATIAGEDKKRWPLANTDPAIGGRIVGEVQRLYREADTKAGGPGKGWRPKDDAEAAEFTRAVLDDIEKHEKSEKARLTSMDAPPAKTGRPTPPPGQRQVPARPGASGDFDRYSRPPKRESVEDRQDRLISRFRGVSLTDE